MSTIPAFLAGRKIWVGGGAFLEGVVMMTSCKGDINMLGTQPLGKCLQNPLTKTIQNSLYFIIIICKWGQTAPELQVVNSLLRGQALTAPALLERKRKEKRNGCVKYKMFPIHHTKFWLLSKIYRLSLGAALWLCLRIRIAGSELGNPWGFGEGGIWEGEGPPQSRMP